MNKKALVITTILELLAVLFIVFILMEVAQAYGESDTVIKINLAEDFRMMVNTLAGVPGEAVIEYPRNLLEFVLILTQNGVIVSKEGESEVKQVIRNYYLPEGYQATGAVKKAKRICLEKKNKVIFVRECLLEETTLVRVPSELGQLDQEGVYTYDAGITSTPIYYRYFKEEWQWSPDQENWMPTTTITVKGGEYDGKSPVKEQIIIIQYLNQYNPNPTEND